MGEGRCRCAAGPEASVHGGVQLAAAGGRVFLGAFLPLEGGCAVAPAHLESSVVALGSGGSGRMRRRGSQGVGDDPRRDRNGNCRAES